MIHERSLVQKFEPDFRNQFLFLQIWIQRRFEIFIFDPHSFVTKFGLVVSREDFADFILLVTFFSSFWGLEVSFINDFTYKLKFKYFYV